MPGILLSVYLLASLVPVYWLVTMSLKSNQEILGLFTWAPHDPT
jgi:glycerol transport system permease protein